MPYTFFCASAWYLLHLIVVWALYSTSARSPLECAFLLIWGNQWLFALHHWDVLPWMIPSNSSSVTLVKPIKSEPFEQWYILWILMFEILAILVHRNWSILNSVVAFMFISMNGHQGDDSTSWLIKRRNKNYIPSSLNNMYCAAMSPAVFFKVLEVATEDLEDWPGTCACCGRWASELTAGVVEVAAEELEDRLRS